MVEHIKNNYPFLIGNRVIVGISGGIDSVCLALVLSKAGAEVVLAHCNFSLRGEESDGDEAFVRDFAKKHGFEFHSIVFDTKAYGKAHGLNTQLSARQLRYNWFERLSQALGISYIAIAHNTNDDIETFFINLSRKTGINGLCGISAVNGKIIRPLLGFTRDDIRAFMASCNQGWREDSSNSSDNYIRNKIRHHITPVLLTLHPEFIKNFRQSQDILKETQSFISFEIDKIRQSCFSTCGDVINIDLAPICSHRCSSFVLFELLRDYGFTNLSDLSQILKSCSGKQLFSSSHRLIKDRGCLILVPLSRVEVSVDKDKILSLLPSDIDLEKTSPPLLVRPWRHGDYFHPSGMGGRKKKLSKFFKDEKYSLLDKERQLVVVDSKDRIVWVVGKRCDFRFLK